MNDSRPASAGKFDVERAANYGTEARIALAGYDACHAIGANLLVATLGHRGTRDILVVGAGGTGSDVMAAGRVGSDWTFTAVDPSARMLALAEEAYEMARLRDRVTTIVGETADITGAKTFDAAICIGVLHHLPGDRAKLALLTDIAGRLPAGAPMLLASNRGAYGQNPLFTRAWRERWVQEGATLEEASARLDKIMAGADPAGSDIAMAALLTRAGFGCPQLYFSSLFWGAWISFRR